MKFKKFRNTILEDAGLTKVRTFFLEALKDYGILLGILLVTGNQHI